MAKGHVMYPKGARTTLALDNPYKLGLLGCVGHEGVLRALCGCCTPTLSLWWTSKRAVNYKIAENDGKDADFGRKLIRMKSSVSP